MTIPPSVCYTSFQGHRRLASGAPHVVALAVKLATERGGDKPILVFDDGTGRAIDLDTRGSDEDVLARHGAAPARDGDVTETPRGRGRPKLVSWHAKSPCYHDTGNGWSPSRAGHPSPCASWWKKRAARTANAIERAPRRSARITSCRPWRAICRVSKKLRALCSQTTARCSAS